MSKLEFFIRPLVAFDPSNKEHRRWYHEFMQYGGWGTCPVRFICPDDIGYDLTIMIRNELIDYYIKKEFKTVKKVDQKLKKLVDSKTKR